MGRLILALGASLVLALVPMEASAHGKKKHQHHHDGEYVVGVGGGAAVGAVIGGPVGALIGGVVGLVVVKVHDEHHHD